VLEEAVAQMRKQGRPECEMADLLMNFKGINVTLSVMAQAVIDGRVDCKTAGRLVVQLQTVSKLLRMMKTKNSPLINTDNTDLQKPEDQNLTAEARRRREVQNNLPVMNTDNTDREKTAEVPEDQPKARRNRAANEREETRIALVAKVLEIANGRGWADAPPGLLRAA